MNDLRAGTTPDASRRWTGNRFLDALPTAFAPQIARIGNLRVYTEGTRLGEAGTPLRDVCFPIAGAISHFEALSDGTCAEVFAVGADGVSGLEALLGESEALHTRIATVPVSAFAVDVAAMEKLCRRSSEVRRLVQRYAAAMIRVAGISAACVQHHRVDARLAAWLLRLLSYARSREFAVTHEMIAAMLGVRRASVTAAAATLAREGAIRFSRKHLEILDPARLVAFTCPCQQDARRIVDAIYAPEAGAAAWRTGEAG